MDTDKLKNRIREALGGAGIPREITEQIDGIIDQEVGKKGDERPKLAMRAQSADHDDEEEDENARAANGFRCVGAQDGLAQEEVAFSEKAAGIKIGGLTSAPAASGS